MTEVHTDPQAVHFPIPFATVQGTVESENIKDLIEALLDCGHRHNFGVEMDHAGPRVWVSEMGAGCIGDILFGRPPKEGELLSAAEQQLTDLLGKAWNLFCVIVEDGPTRSDDLAEIATKIHDLQHAVMAQAAARAYPDTYRPLGNVGEWARS